MQTTGCLPRYSPSIAHTAQTEGRCLWHLHLPDLFYSSRFKLTYCSHLLRENEKRENLKAWSVSTVLGCPSQRATAPWKISPADGRQVSPEKTAQSHSFPGLKSSTSPQMLSHLFAVRDEEAHRRQSRAWIQKTRCCLTALTVPAWTLPVQAGGATWHLVLPNVCIPKSKCHQSQGSARVSG